MQQFLLSDVGDEFCNDDDDKDQYEIIGDLQVVGIQLQRSGNGGQHQTPKVFAFIGQQHASDDGSHIGHGNGFGVVARSDDDVEVGGEPVCDGA